MSRITLALQRCSEQANSQALSVRLMSMDGISLPRPGSIATFLCGVAAHAHHYGMRFRTGEGCWGKATGLKA